MNPPTPHPAGVTIRPLSAADLDAVLALEQASDSAPHWSRADYLACIACPDDDPGNSALHRFGLVARQEGSLAGFAIVRILSAAGSVEAELESILVAPNRRSRGIGAALLDHLSQATKMRGALKLGLEVRPSNTSAIRLYQRAGFSEAGRRRAYYSHPEEDALLMSLSL